MSVQRLTCLASVATMMLLASCFQGLGVADIPEPPPEAGVAPTLSDLTVSPAVAGPDHTVTISFFTDQLLDLDTTTVTVDGRPATYEATVAGTIYTYRYQATGDEAQGAVSVAVNALNTFQLGRELSTSDLVFDFTDPTLTAPTPATVLDGFVPASFTVSGEVVDEGTGVETCLVCSLPVVDDVVPPADSCQWLPAASFGTTCTATGITCLNEQQVAIRLRAADTVGNINDSDPTVVTCDSAPPTANTVTVTPSSSLYVGPAFAVATQFGDASAVQRCQVCVANDGTCDDGDWVDADLGTDEDGIVDECTANVSLACTDGDDVLVNMRAVDVLSSTWGTAAGQLRTCDGNPVTLSELDISGGDEIVGLEFSTTVVIDEGNGSPADVCEVCATSAGSCGDDDFAPGVFQGDSCRASIACADGDELHIQIRVTDAAGNVATSNEEVRTCDADAEGAGVGVPTTPGAGNDTHVGTTFVLQASVDPDAASCETCVSLSGECSESDWQAGGVLTGGFCQADLTCSDGERLTLGVRARDAVGNVGEAETISRTCDGAGPVPGIISAANQVDDGYASPSFQLSATFVDGSAGVGGCESCVANDGTCDDEWTSDGATFSGGSCVADVICVDGDELTIGLRATDLVGNASVTGPAAQLVCDGAGPALADLAVSGDAATTGVVSPPFTVSVDVSDGPDAAGVESCQICVSTDGTCDTEWQGGTLAGDTCSVPSLSCSDGDALTISARASDGVGNDSAPGALPPLTRTCDSTGPLVGGLTIDGGGNSFTHVNQNGFDVQMVADDAISSMLTCEVCVSGDGLCDDDELEWQPAAAIPDPNPLSDAVTCQAQGLSCGTSGATYTIAMRTTDEAGFVTTSAPATRVCDGQAPKPTGPMTLVAGAEVGGAQTYVEATGFVLTAGFTDFALGAGVTHCDVCVGTSCPPGADFNTGAWSIGVYSPAANTCTTSAPLTCTDGEAFMVAMRGRDGTGQLSAPTVLDVICDGAAPSVLIDTTLSQVGPGFPDVTATHTGRLFSLEATFDDPGVDPSGLVGCESCVATDGACNTEGDWAGAILDDGTNLCHVDTVACVDGQSITIAMRATDLLGHVTETTELVRTCDDSPPLTGAVLTVAGANVTHVRGAGAGFDIQATFTDLLSSVPDCERCVSTDGVCDEEWVDADFDSLTGRCSTSGLTCADLDDLVLQMRAFDIVGNEATTVPIARSCDEQAPSAPALSADNPEPYELILDWAEVVELGAGLDTYAIEFDTDQSGAPYDNVTLTPFAGYTLGEVGDVLPPCTTHWVRLRATDRVGNEAAGNEIEMRTRCGGTGAFTAGATVPLYPTGVAQTSIGDLVSGDFNGDGVLDLIAGVADNGAGLDPDPLQVLLGNKTNGRADGTFTVAAPIEVSGMVGGALTLAAGDVDNDGHQDVLYLTIGDDTVRVLINNGDATFTYSAALDRNVTSSLSRDLVTGDMNRDGILDWVAASRSNTVDVRLGHGAGGRGNGAFNTAQNLFIPGGGEIYTARIADFDGDDIPDIAAMSRQLTRLFIYTQGGSGGRGDGTFTVTEDVPVSAYNEMAIGDFNGDTVTDMITAGGDVYISGGTDDGLPGDGSLLPAVIYPVSGTHGIETADLNRDNIVDVVMAGGGQLTIMMGQGTDGRGDGTFAVQTVALAGAPQHPVIGDFNDDAIPDIAVILDGDTLQLLLGVGGSLAATGALANATDVIATNADATTTLVADFNGDAIPDIGYAAKNINGFPPMSILLGVGTNGQLNGGYVPFGSMNTARFPWEASAADLDEDGAVDLVISARAAGTGNNLGDLVVGWNILSDNEPSATFERDAAGVVGDQSLRGFALADFNDDGALDAATAHEGGDITIALNDAVDGRGQRSWLPHTNYAVGGTPEFIVVGDFNSDGLEDVAAAVDRGAGAVDSLEIIFGQADGTGHAGGRSDGTFGAAQVVSSSIDTALRPRTADLNHDKIPDLIVGGGTTIDIFLGDSTGGYADGTFTVGTPLTGFGNVVDFDAADVNGDGVVDLVIIDKAGAVRQAQVYLGGGSDGVGTASFTFFDQATVTDRESYMHLVDVDQDGALDVVVGNDNEQLRILRGEGALVTVD